MTSGNFGALHRVFLQRYDDLKTRLTRRLGSADLAGEALQDTWLRLHDAGGVEAVRHADAYLFTVAINIARDRRRAEARRLTAEEIGDLLDIPDEAPDQARVAESRAELRLLETVLLELPPRQRAILLAARLEDMPRAEIAKRFRISVRLVQSELLAAQDYCAARIKRLTTLTPRSSALSAPRVRLVERQDTVPKAQDSE